MYELDEEFGHEWIRSLLAAGVEGIGGGDGGGGGDRVSVGAVSRDDVLAVGRARLARRRLSAAMVLAVVAVLAVAGYVIGSAGVGTGTPGGRGVVTASTTPSVRVRQGPAIGTAARIDPSPTPSAS
jgi:hypothetical protein